MLDVFARDIRGYGDGILSVNDSAKNNKLPLFLNWDLSTIAQLPGVLSLFTTWGKASPDSKITLHKFRTAFATWGHKAGEVNIYLTLLFFSKHT